MPTPQFGGRQNDSADPDIVPPPGEVPEPLTDITEVRLRAAIESAPDGMVIHDANGLIVLVNRQAEVLFNYDRLDLLGRSIEELLPERLRAQHREHRKRYQANPQVRAMGAGLELWARRSDGTEFPVEISLSPIGDSGGGAVVAAIRDVSERFSNEQRLNRISQGIAEIRSHLRDDETAPDWIKSRTLTAICGHVQSIADASFSAVGVFTKGTVEWRAWAGIAPDEWSDHALPLGLSIADDSAPDLQVLEFTSTSGGPGLAVFHDSFGGSRIMLAIRGANEAAFDAHVRAGVATYFIQLMAEIDLIRTRRTRALLAISEERERIARDLHDTVIQDIFAASMTIESVLPTVTDERSQRRLSQLVDDLDSTIRRLRRAVFGLHNVATASGLSERLLATINEADRVLGHRPELRLDGAIDVIDQRVAAEMEPTLREALSNVARHARASATIVAITVDAGSVTLEVTDNGVGMPASVRPGSGTENIRERAARLGGTASYTNQPGGGTRLSWTVPTRSSNRSDDTTR